MAPTSTTTYYVTGYNAEGCSAQAEITVKVKTSGIEENSMDAKLYPNPTQGYLTIEAIGMQHISIHNVIGQMVFDATTDSDNTTIDMTQFGNGIYTVRIATNDGTCVKRVCVE